MCVWPVCVCVCVVVYVCGFVCVCQCGFMCVWFVVCVCVCVLHMVKFFIAAITHAHPVAQKIQFKLSLNWTLFVFFSLLRCLQKDYIYIYVAECTSLILILYIVLPEILYNVVYSGSGITSLHFHSVRMPLADVFKPG